MNDAEYIEGLLASAGQLSAFVLFASGVSAAAIAVKLAKKDELDLKVVKISLNHYWVAAICLTVIHLYLGFVQTDAAQSIARLSPAARQSAWLKLTHGKESPVLFRSMQQRPANGEIRIPFLGRQPSYGISKTDNTLWLSLALVSLAGVSVYFVHQAKARSKVIMAIFATSISVANWFIGGTWAIATSNMHP